MTEFTYPIKRHIIREIVIDTQGLKPSFVSITITTPLKAKTEPTDKSNSPETIKIITPIAIRAISGDIVNKTLKFRTLKNLSLIK